MLKNIISVIDGAAGSCGKAKVVGEIASRRDINLGASITNCMPNAGHTFVSESGEKCVFQNIPVSAINPNTELFIGPGSAIDLNTFSEEYKRVEKYIGDRLIYVHEMVPIIDERHKEFERVNIKSGSTNKGCGAVSAEKILRYPVLDFFKGYKKAIVLSNDEWLDKLYSHIENENEYVLMEGSQGCDLDLNHSGNYPYVTSRNVSTTQLLADSGISAERLLQTIMVIRPFPIRISNITKEGKYIYTGDYGSGEKLTWTQINFASMFGGYPTTNDLEAFANEIDFDYIKYLYDNTPEVFLKQLFGINYKDIDIKELTLLEMLELERLYNKSINERDYVTKILDLFLFAESKDEINLIHDQSEQTTVTKMERRIFDLDIKKLKNNCRINTPSSLYLNFFQHLSYDHKDISGNYEDIYINRYIREYLNWLESECGIDISMLGTGSKNNMAIKKLELLRPISK